jgi:hypothetical protein
MASVRHIAHNGSKWSSPSGRETKTNSFEPAWGLARLASIWRGFYDSFAPLGYEDETGFHYGDRPEEN